MAKLTLTDLTSLTSNEASAVSTINANNAATEAALEKTLSRDGTTPNTMDADIDMNSNDLLNVGAIDATSISIGGVPITGGGGGGTGPQGPQGPQGATGAAGTNGTNGTNGSDGAAGPQGTQGPQGASGSGTFVAASSTNSAYMDFAEDTDNGTNKVRVKSPDALSADATVNLPGTTGDILSTAETKTITKGFTVTPHSIGTVSSGTTTPDPANGNYQYLTNGGAFTLAAPSSDCAIDILVINGASSGAITFSGFKTPGSGVAGATYATTDATWWMISIRRANGVSIYNVNGPWT